MCAEDAGEASDSATAVAAAAADAFAGALASVDVECAASQAGSVCAWSAAAAQGFAEAHAAAVVQAIARVDNGCGCELDDVSVLVAAVETAFTSVTAEVLAGDVCVAGALSPAANGHRSSAALCCAVRPPLVSAVLRCAAGSAVLNRSPCAGAYLPRGCRRRRHHGRAGG